MPTSSCPVHGEIDCVDAEALLADAVAEVERLRAENHLLTRRLDIAIMQKDIAIDEAVTARA